MSSAQFWAGPRECQPTHIDDMREWTTLPPWHPEVPTTACNRWRPGASGPLFRQAKRTFGDKPVEYRISTINTASHDYVSLLAKR